MKDNNENVQLLDVDLGLPDHESDIKHAEEVLDKLRREFESVKDIDDEKHESYYEATMKILDFVGRLSLPAFKTLQILEDEYIKAYPNAPALAKELWLKHYGNIHRPYNIIKNRCFRLLNEIDDKYIEKYKSVPPNWNP
ncbi:MAG: hypothetical protein ACOC22_04450 [bacterium]